MKAVDGNAVNVEITFQVTFIKSTYMKYIIDRSTNFEMTKWLEAFFAHLKKVLLAPLIDLCFLLPINLLTIAVLLCLLDGGPVQGRQGEHRKLRLAAA